MQITIWKTNPTNDKKPKLKKFDKKKWLKMMKLAVIAFLLFSGALIEATRDTETLVLLDSLATRETHSIFFKGLLGKNRIKYDVFETGVFFVTIYFNDVSIIFFSMYWLTNKCLCYLQSVDLN